MTLTRTEKLLLLIAIGILKQYNPRNEYFKAGRKLLKTDSEITDLLQKADDIFEWTDELETALEDSEY
jgi:hypothetical protein